MGYAYGVTNTPPWDSSSSMRFAPYPERHRSGSDTICNIPPTSTHNIVRFAPLAHGFVSGDLVRTSQEVTHPGTTPTLTRLTAAFQEPAARVAPKRVVVRKTKILLITPNITPVHGRYGICLRCYNIPPGLQLENLVGLDMSYSRLVSFDMSYGDPQRLQKRQKLTTGLGSKDKPLLRSLKILNLSYSERLRSLGGFSEFPALERLILSNWINLVEVCESIEQCDGLVLIDLSDCNEAGMLLRTIGKVNNVKILNLDRCNLGDIPIEMSDFELPEIVEANNVVINSQTSSSAIVEVIRIPRDLRSSGIFLPDSLVSLSLKDNHLSNESFPIDMSSLLMLKELCLDGNDILSLPNCVRTLPRLEKLSIQVCRNLKTIEHPPCTLKRLEYHIWRKLGKIVFDQDMSPIKLSGMALDGFFIEGMFKYEDMGDVEEEVLRSLGWTNIDFTKIQPVQTGSEVQMLYEFGIFSTVYRGKEMPNWISDIREGSSISFTIPSSPYNLRGLNFCFVLTVSPTWHNLPYVDMKISNITRNRTWIYFCRFSLQEPVEGTIVYLSHWIFGKNEMEDGDQITISILDNCFISIRECGVSLVYDDGKMEEEDVLGYYKSWNHIIGGDLSPFQTSTPGEYLIDHNLFFGATFRNVYADWHPLFRAYPQRK